MVRAEAFLDIEASLADRLYAAWRLESRPLLRRIWNALEAGDKARAVDLATGIDLSALVERNIGYIDYLSQNALLFGATRLTPDPRETSIPGGNFDDVLESSKDLLTKAIRYNVEDYVRFGLLESIAAYDLADPATNFTAPDGRLADYVVKYDPNEPRDEKGRWTDGGAASGIPNQGRGEVFHPTGLAGEDFGRDTQGATGGIPASYARGNRAVFVRLAGEVPATRWTPAPGDKTLINARGFPAPDYLELHPSPTASKAFIEQITAAKEASAAGASVYVYPPEDYAKMRLFVTDDGNAGFAIKPDGDIVSLFNKPGGLKGVAFSALHLAVQNGGRKLDAFDTVLPAIYAKAGFTPTSRLHWDDSQAPAGWSKDTFKKFNNGEPDVVFMAFDPKRGDKPYVQGEGKLVTDYDEAVRLQQEKVVKHDADYYEDPDAPGEWVLFSERAIKFSPDQARGKTVPGTNEGSFAPAGGDVKNFSASLGIKRKDMPQIRGRDMAEFTQWAAQQGVAVTPETAPISTLKPAQIEYNQKQVDQMPLDIAAEAPLTVSRDSYVLDGTNRLVRLQHSDLTDIKVRRIDLPAKEALALMHRFPKAFRKDVGQVGATAVAKAEWDEEAHPREPAGSPHGGEWSKQVRAGELGEGMTLDPATKLWMHNGRPVSERDQARLKAFPVPPAWVHVHLNPDETAPLQVLGQDAAARWQPKYSVKWTAQQKLAKFARGRDYNEIAPQVAKDIERDMQDAEKAGEAAAMRLIQLTGIRIGGEKGEGVKHTAIGASTLKGQHVKVDGDKITLSFTGKSAVRQHFTVQDSLLAGYLRGKVGADGKLPKGELVFGTTDAKMREYFKTVTGDRKFLVKDVRMWVGTATAIKELKKVREPKNVAEFKAMAKVVATKVSKVLGNTPAMAMGSYIDPLVWQPWNARFPGALEPKKKVKKSDTLDELQALNDEFYASVSFDGPLPDWRDMPDTGLDPEDSEADARRVKELNEDPLDLRAGRAVASKAEVVRPFVSFANRTDSTASRMLQLVAGLHTSRLSAYGFVVEAEVTGLTTYMLSAQLDNRTCPVCAYMDGKIFDVADASDSLNEILKVDDPNDLETMQPWPRQDEQNLEEMMQMTEQELVDRNWHIPPYHPNCRCLLVPVDSDVGTTSTASYRAANPNMDSVFTNEAVLNEALSVDDAIRIRAIMGGADTPAGALALWNSLKDTYPVDVLESVMGVTDEEMQAGNVYFAEEQ